MNARRRGFTLVELAVVLAIVGFLLGTLMYTLSAQTEQRNFDDTRRRLDQARELVLSFAMVNGRLPCPATAASSGDESFTAGVCTTWYNGWLPARTIGFPYVDTAGFAIDVWGNRLRYAVAQTKTNCSGAGPFPDPHFVNAANLKQNGITCQPNDLLVCRSATAPAAPPLNAGASPPTCGAGGANQIMASGLVVALILSTGKNGGTPTSGVSADEQQNLNGDALFVFHTPTPADAATGEFDDHLTWITHGELYGKLVAAGVLP